jgi:hypothetical protein
MSILTGRELEFLASLNTRWQRLYWNELVRLLKEVDGPVPISRVPGSVKKTLFRREMSPVPIPAILTISVSHSMTSAGLMRPPIVDADAERQRHLSGRALFRAPFGEEDGPIRGTPNEPARPGGCC